MGIDVACVQKSPVYRRPPPSVHRLVLMSWLKYRETLYSFNLGLPEYKGYTLCLLAGTDERDLILARVKN